MKFTVHSGSLEVHIIILFLVMLHYNYEETLWEYVQLQP